MHHMYLNSIFGFTYQEKFKKTFKRLFLCARFQGNLEVFMKWIKNSSVTNTSGSLGLCKIHALHTCMDFGLNQVSHINPFATLLKEECKYQEYRPTIKNKIGGQHIDLFNAQLLQFCLCCHCQINLLPPPPFKTNKTKTDAVSWFHELLASIEWEKRAFNDL